MGTSENIIQTQFEGKMFNDFDIDTGAIFSDLESNWKNLDTVFLQTTVQEALQAVLLKKGIVTCQKANVDDEYFLRKSKEYFEFKSETGKFPFPTYFISLDNLIAYSHSVILKKTDNYFDLFFALKLSLVKTIEIRAFLLYQLEISFAGDTPTFITYLHDLLLSYSFFTPQMKQIVQNYLDTNIKIKEEVLNKEILQQDDGDNLKDFTTQRQCLAIYYLLIQVGIVDIKTGNPTADITKADILKLISFLTTKNESNIKKAYNTMLGKGSEKIYLENLRFIRPYFEKLQLKTALEQLNKALEGATP